MNEKINKHIILHLSLIAGVGPATIKAVLDNLTDTGLERLYQFQVSDFSDCGISYDRAMKIVAGLKDQSTLNKELALIEKYQINWCTLACLEYSQLLSQIEQPPAVIYYQGRNLFHHEKVVAFVGSRKADAYARVVTDKLIPPLVQDDWVIVSGGALGVDSLVHDKTIQSRGKTIVVLGSGLLNWYPASNSGLFNQVVQSGGMIVSCFSLQTQPIPSNFPARNRIIAGLSQGTVVVQAASKSGALITADFALEQGRQVFAIPGSIEHGLHDGCHYLIQQGAKLVTTVHDITVEFGFDKTETEDVQTLLPLSMDTLDPLTIALLDKLLVARSTDNLLTMLDVSLEDLMQKLFDLSLEGKISQDIMGLWKRI